MRRAIIWIAVSSKQQTNDDKSSLESQERDAIMFCKNNDYTIIETLRVTGHSRRYLDWNQLKLDASSEGINAFNRLEQHWHDQDFDVLVVRDGDRFARTQTLHALVVESTINSGAIIYSLADGFIDDKNYRMWIAMNGYRSASEIDSLTKKIKFGMDKRAKRGLHTGRHPPKSHVAIRDEFGKTLRLEVNPKTQHEIITAIEYLLNGDASFYTLNRLMTDSHNYPEYYEGYYYKLFSNPVFWGHTARNFAKKHGLWRIEQGHDIPSGVTMYYHTHDPAIQNPLHDEFLAYLRIKWSQRGKLQHRSQKRYSGLIVCPHCGYNRVYSRLPLVDGNDRIYLRCVSRAKCNSPRILQSDIDPVIHQWLSVLIKTGNRSQFQQIKLPDINIDDIDNQIEQLQIKLINLIEQSAQFTGIALNTYQQQIQKTSDEIEQLQVHRNQQLSKLQSIKQVNQDYQNTVEKLRAMTLDTFWRMPDHQQNQLLHRLFGNRQIVVDGNSIIGVTSKS